MVTHDLPARFGLSLARSICALVVAIAVMQAGGPGATWGQDWKPPAKRHPSVAFQNQNAQTTSAGTVRVAKRHPLARQDSEPAQESSSDQTNSATPDGSATALPAESPPERRRTGRRSTKPIHFRGEFFTTNRFDFANLGAPISGYSEYVIPGRFKTSDNNSAIPETRLLFQYQNFFNGLDAGTTNLAGSDDAYETNVNQFVVGFEKAFGFAENWSIEVRLPVYGEADILSNNGFSTNAATTGNLIVVTKHVLAETRNRVISSGLGLSLPTGDDSEFIALEEMFTIRNQAVHLQPYVAGLWTPNQCWFLHGFAGFDFSSGGNCVEYRPLVPYGPPVGAGHLAEQPLAFVDLGAGRWWYRNPCARGVTGFNTSIEFHYTTTIEDADEVTGTTTYNDFRVSPESARFDLMNVTLGSDIEINQDYLLRFGWVVPLRSDHDRFFDNEVQAHITRRR